ncbi:hypothetical protein M0R45_025097 [Rubus argutus]|uniref:Uncharacterized protein n=1 Tax=Rubus argutus TaxID=59490 RepID=A0AAW1WTJ1_RUBAR
MKIKNQASAYSNGEGFSQFDKISIRKSSGLIKGITVAVWPGYRQDLVSQRQSGGVARKWLEVWFGVASPGSGLDSPRLAL